MMNVGGGNPGVGDMATLGSPAKFTCCLAEAEEESPFEPLHVSFGFGRSDSTVTLLGVEGPHSFMFTFEDFPFNEERLLQTLAAGFSNPCSNNIYFAKGMVAVALNPMHARLLAKKGLSRQDIQKKLYDYASVDRASLVAIVGNNINCSPQKGGLQHIVPSPEHILVFVAGEEGATYSAYFPTWGGGSNGQFAVTKKVRSEDLCEIPVSRR
jgi:hypothetical protein